MLILNFLPSLQEKVLHNVMSVFTFMGASVVRQDDSYSFEVITKTLDTVIPALIQVCSYSVLFLYVCDKSRRKLQDKFVRWLNTVYMMPVPHLPFL